MRLTLSNGDYVYFEQNDTKLVELNDHTCIVGDSILYGVTEDSKRVRLSPSSSLSNLEYFDSDTNEWTTSTLEVDFDSVPVSMYADDTYNFDNFSLPLILVFGFAMCFIILFRSR